MLSSINKKNISQQMNVGEREIPLSSPKQTASLPEVTTVNTPKPPSRKPPSAPKGAEALNSLIDKVLDELDF
jgi:hypothetical protein